MNYVRALQEVIPPPRPPIHSTAVRFDNELDLPDDYIELIEAYGAGSFADANLSELYIFDLLTDTGRPAVDEALSIARERTFFTPDGPLSVFPSNPGLLPWGRDDQGFLYFWIVDRNPESWTVAVGRHNLEVFESTLSQFIFDAVSASENHYEGLQFSSQTQFYPNDL